MELQSFVQKIVHSCNNIKGEKLSVVRYGNVMGSGLSDSILSQQANGSLPITDPNMTRFNISLSEGVEMVLWSLGNALGGELFVPNTKLQD